MKLSVPVLLGLSFSTSLAQEPDELFELSPFEVATSPNALRPDALPLPVAVIHSDALLEQSSASLGSTLEGQPGISAGSFAPGASRPIIRGQDGERVRLLEGGMEPFDLSASGPDHASATDPMLAGSVSVLRGPATLLYGGSAIGGTVSTDMAEIPLDDARGSIPQNIIGLRGSSGSRGVALAGRTTTSLGSSKLRLQGVMRNEGDYITPQGYTLPDRDHSHHDDGETGTDHADDLRRLPGTFVRSRYGSAGWGFTGRKADIGLSSSIYTSEYGVPFHTHSEHKDHDHEHHDHEDGHPVTVKLERIRHTAEVHLADPTDFIEILSLKAVAGQYWHEEREEDMVTTRFKREGHELRLDAMHREIRGVGGVLGVSYLDTSFSAEGAEALAPPSETSSAAVFLAEEWRQHSFWIQGGIRLERNDIQVESDAPDYDDTALSASVSVTRRLGGSWTIDLSGILASRHPSATELYANGPHASTARFEIGDPSLGIERARNLEASLRKTSGTLTGGLQLFVADYDNYIHLRDTDDEHDGLTVAQFEATEARFYGGEAHLTWKIWSDSSLAIELTHGGDYVAARDRRSSEPLPRIPAARVFSKLELRSGQQWKLGVNVRHSFRQHEIAQGEAPTESYTMVNLEGSFEVPAGRSSIRIFASIQNVFDELGYHHTSFIKDYAPIAGRHIRGGVIVSF